MPNKRTEILFTLNKASKAADTELEALHKVSQDQHGIFQHFKSNVVPEYATRPQYLLQRGGEAPSRDIEALYNVGRQHEDSKVTESEANTSLSTRYSPDRVGVQARRIGDGIMQDPYTNKIYDYNEGFKSEDGREFPGGSVSLQSDLMNLASLLDEKGLIKEADSLDLILKQAQGFDAQWRFEALGPRYEDALTQEELRVLMDAGYPPPYRDIDRSTPWAREVLGLQAPAASPTEVLPTERENRPLTMGEIAALFKAHEDPSSDYKLDPSSLAQMTNANLSEEEATIVDGASEISAVSSSVVRDLIRLATHLDEKGLTGEATYIDSLLSKNN